MAQKKRRFESEAALVQAAKEIVAPSLGRVYGLTDEFDCNDDFTYSVNAPYSRMFFKAGNN